jgi:hypothetical protein
MLKDILNRHKSHRPPYSIFIFTEKEVSKIINFMLNSFFRHYAMYEYSFKPKVEIVLMTLPKGGIPGESTDKGRESREKMNNVNEALSNLDLEKSAKEMATDVTPQNQSQSQEAEEEEDPNIDWQKVGRLYKPESAIDHIVNKEMSRLKNAFDQNIDIQDTVLEEKFKNPKKK